MAGSKGKAHHSGPHGDARKVITIRNKARRAKRYARIEQKRKELDRIERISFARITRRAARKEAFEKRIKDFRSKNKQSETNEIQIQQVTDGGVEQPVLA